MSHTVLSTHDYDKWTRKWKTEVEDSVGPLPYFLYDDNDKVITGVKFHFESLRYLFSTPGVVTIKVRFGLHRHHEGDQLRLHLILFGANSRDQTVTPYYTSAAFTHHHHYRKNILAEGNLPQPLMRLWKEYWHEQASDNHVTKDMFWLHREDGGLLKGYSYSLTEVMNAIGTFSTTSVLHVRFGLHEYYLPYEEPEAGPKSVCTFGLILYADVRVSGETIITSPPSESEESALAAEKAFFPEDDDDPHDIIDESGFYDFTAPCPYTC